MNVHEFLNTYLGGNKNISTLTYDALAEMLTDYAKALQLHKTNVSGSYSPIITMMKKYHEIGLELEKRKKVVTDIQDLIVIDLQIRTNKIFESDIINLAKELIL